MTALSKAWLLKLHARSEACKISEVNTIQVAPLPSCQHTRRTTDAPLLSDPPLETGITPGLPAVIELASLPAVHPLSSVPSAPGILPGAAAATAPAVKGTTGSRTSALKGAPFHGVSLPGQASANSPGRQAQGSSSGTGSRGSVESFNATGQPADATPGVGQGHDRAALGACLGGLLEDLRDGRELLRNSYILAYFLSWDERRRCGSFDTLHGCATLCCQSSQPFLPMHRFQTR